MKTMISKLKYKMTLLVMMVMSTVYAIAQEGATSSSHTSTSSSTTTGPDTTELWYNAPWVWIVGAGVVLLILFLQYPQHLLLQ